MTEIADELLMAYADGELRGTEREHVEAHLRTNPAAALRVAEFAATRDGLSRLLNHAFLEPVPERLLATIMAEEQLGRTPGRKMPPSPPRLATLWRRVTSPLAALFDAWPLTASAMMTASAILGIAIGSQWTPNVAPPRAPASALVSLENGQLMAAGALATALETVPSGKPAIVTSGTDAPTVQPVLSFATKAGGYCRQVALSGAGGRSAALSCRAPDGRWMIEATAPLGVAARPGDVGVAGSISAPALDAAVTRLMKGDALSPEHEHGLIARKWVETTQ